MTDQQNSGAKHITDGEFEELVLKSSKPVLVDFFAPWCGPCRMAGPIIDKLATEHSDIKIYKLNVDENSETAQKYGVMSIPTVITFKDGKEFERKMGFAGEGGYQDMIKSVLK